MAKSKAQRRRARQGQTVIPYARMMPNLSNYIVGPSWVNSAGALVAGDSWRGGATAMTLVTGVPQTIQAAALVAAVNTSTPTIGRMKIDEIRGRLSLTGFTVIGRYQVGVGIYVSQQNSQTPTYDVRDTLIAADAARDDWFMLEMMEFEAPVTGTNTALSFIEIPLRLANALIIGGGQAVHVTISMTGAGNCKVTPAFRTRVAGVA